MVCLCVALCRVGTSGVVLQFLFPALMLIKLGQRRWGIALFAAGTLIGLAGVFATLVSAVCCASGADADASPADGGGLLHAAAASGSSVCHSLWAECRAAS